MDVNSIENAEFEVPPREKRTLRAAVEGSPNRPEPKCLRGDNDGDDSDARETTADPQADVSVFARFAPAPHARAFKPTHFEPREQKQHVY